LGCAKRNSMAAVVNATDIVPDAVTDASRSIVRRQVIAVRTILQAIVQTIRVADGRHDTPAGLAHSPNRSVRRRPPVQRRFGCKSRHEHGDLFLSKIELWRSG